MFHIILTKKYKFNMIDFKKKKIHFIYRYIIIYYISFMF